MEATEARRLLGVRPSAGMAELKSAFRRSALAHHPDHGGRREQFQAVHQAFRLLEAVMPSQPAGPAFAAYRLATAPVSSRVWDEEPPPVRPPETPMDFEECLARELRKMVAA